MAEQFQKKNCGTPIEIVSPVEDNGGVPVNVQDQTTDLFSLKLTKQITGELTLGGTPIVNEYAVTLSDAESVSGGQSIAILEQDGVPRLLYGKILSKDGNTLTLDTPVNYPFDNADMDDTKFGGITALTRGIVLRKKKSDNTYLNFFNVKDNGSLGDLSVKKEYASKAGSGLYGLTACICWAGQENHGVVNRLEMNESIELLIQDDLTGLASFKATVHGHLTQD